MAKFFGMAKGTTRVVLLIGKYAVKFPRLCDWFSFARGLCANQTERLVYGDNCKYFLPVLWASKTGLLLIMPRVKTATKDTWYFRAFMADLHHQDNDDYGPAMVARNYCEFVPSNYALYKGIPVCIDYGSKVEPATMNNIMDMEFTYWRHKLNEKINGSEVANREPFWSMEDA